MTRREFSASLAAASAPAARRPLAITMWDFSWLERRWPGAGYEDWDLALDELKARGYHAVRLDAYPHLVAADPARTWELLPCWTTQDWGAPARCRVQVQPALNQFLDKCARRGMQVGLSTWFRQDLDDTRMKIATARDLGQIWKRTIDSIDARLRDHILYVDLCNEWPLDVWAPYLRKGWRRNTAENAEYMKTAIGVVKDAHPSLRYTFSFTSEYQTWAQQDVSMLDLLELHIWMTHSGDFYQQVGYHYARFDFKDYDNVALKAEALYRSKPDFWKARLEDTIKIAIEWSRAVRKPLITTECWAIVDYRDFPLLNWDWIKELCEHGVRTAAASGRWEAMGTSNFCGPQFRGMWRDVAWHRRLTRLIGESRRPEAG
jgi:hypothetical protein